MNERIERLHSLAAEHSYSFRQQFQDQTVELLVERPGANAPADSGLQHGRCERYFDVFFESERARVGESVKVRIDRVTTSRTIGTILEPA